MFLYNHRGLSRDSPRCLHPFHLFYLLPSPMREGDGVRLSSFALDQQTAFGCLVCTVQLQDDDAMSLRWQGNGIAVLV